MAERKNLMSTTYGTDGVQATRQNIESLNMTMQGKMLKTRA
jgi:hypothetical protein